MKKDVVDYSPKWMGAIYCPIIIYGLDLKRSRWSRDFCNTLLVTRNLKSKIGDWSKKKCDKRYTTQVCVSMYISKLLWTRGKLRGGKKHQYRCGVRKLRKITNDHLNMQKHKWMCWKKYHSHTHIKGIQSWIKQGI
jgi:hypothetical protein